MTEDAAGSDVLPYRWNGEYEDYVGTIVDFNVIAT